MRRQPSLPIAVAAVTYGLLAHTMPAKAASPVTWVSGTGKDVGACPIANPCRTFQYAFTQTSNGGVINVLSAGSFGKVNITKSISIVADGVEALIQSTVACPGGGTAAICISGSATVNLRGLIIDLGGSAGKDGIRFNSGKALHVQNSVIRRAGAVGILFMPTSAAKLFVSNTTTADNALAIQLNASAPSSLSASLDRVHVNNNNSGFNAFAGSGTIRATIRDSVAADNHIGISLSTSGGTANVMIDRTVVANNSFLGLFANNANATARIGDSTITGNLTGLATLSGGQIISYGTNKLNGNTGDGAPTSTIAMQ